MKNQKLADVPLGEISTGDVGISGDPVEKIAQLISTTIALLTVIAGIYFIFNIITASIGIISGAGDKGVLEGARTKLTHSIIGLVLTISAMFIIGVLNTVFGLPNILEFGTMIDAIRN